MFAHIADPPYTVVGYTIILTDQGRRTDQHLTASAGAGVETIVCDLREFHGDARDESKTFMDPIDHYS